MLFEFRPRSRFRSVAGELSVKNHRLSDPGGSRGSSPDNELVTKSEILTNSNRDRLRISAANGCRCRNDSHSPPRSANSQIFDLDEFALSGPGAFGSFSIQVFRTSAPSKGQEKRWENKSVDVTRRAVGERASDASPPSPMNPEGFTTNVQFGASHRCQRAPATSAGSGRSGRIRRSG